MRVFLVTLFTFVSFSVSAEPPKNQQRSRFYDFGTQVIDGEIRRPQFLYTDARQKARFERLLRLKKSFLSRLYETSNSRVFK